MSNPFIVVFRHGPRKDDNNYSIDFDSDYGGNVPIADGDKSTKVIKDSALLMKHALEQFLGRTVTPNDLQFVVSPYERCIQTCDIIKSTLRVFREKELDIVDPDFGEIFSPGVLKINEERAGALCKMLQNKVTARDKEGKLKKQPGWSENREMAYSRYRKAFAEYSNTQGSKPVIIIVSHGDSLNALLSQYCTTYSVEYASFLIFRNQVPLARNGVDYLDPISSLRWPLEEENLSSALKESEDIFFAKNEDPSKTLYSSPLPSHSGTNNDYISLQVLSGFMITLGAASFFIAFAFLNATTFGATGVITATVGATSMLIGCGLFSSTYNEENYDLERDIALDARSNSMNC